MVLKSCNTGSLNFQNNISRVLTQQNPGLTIYSASHNWGADGRVQYHSNSKLHYGVYNKYQDGRFLYGVPNK